MDNDDLDSIIDILNDNNPINNKFQSASNGGYML